MTFKFLHSRVVIRELAQEAARTPPSEEDSPLEYVDRGLTILGRTFDSHSERLRQEFLGQREFIASQIKEVEAKINGRFKEMDGRFEEIDGRLKEMENKMDGRFEEIDGRLKEMENKMDGRSKEIENKMDKRFQDVDEKIDKKIEGVEKRMRNHLDLLHNASRNFLRTRGWEAISPVGLLDPGGGINIPEYFPRTIRHFWRLKDASQSK